MVYFTTEEFIKKHIRFQQHWKKRIITMTDAKWQTLSQDTHVGGYEYAEGSQFKVFETKNFGWVVFDPQTLTPQGHIPGRRILNW